MDQIRTYMNRPLVAGIVGGIIGLIIGLIFAWGLWPVQWTDATPELLRADLQADYLRAAIDSYAQSGDPIAARQRYEALGEAGPEVLQQIQANPEQQSLDAVAAFTSVVTAGAPPAAGQTPEATEEAPAGGSFLRTLLPIFCILTVLLLAALVLIFVLRNRGGMKVGGTPTPAMQAQQAAREAEYTNYEAMGEEPPMAQFMASYKLGDDLFDDSFSVDSPSGEFLGECGVGISETIGVGDPKKVTAFEVWLFDKNDIQTVTKVLMSNHAFDDDGIRQRLAAKGEPVLATPGSQAVLETATLQLVARVVDMSYGEGALPDKSFFDSLILELAVWQK